MTTFGYAKQYMYAGDNTLQIQVRIPSIHGPYKQSDYKGKAVRNYVKDEDLPFYPSLLLPHLPHNGDVVAVTALDKGNTSFLVVGLMGSSYQQGNMMSGD